ncbi:MAG TPA: protein-glutamate O-methyltransferase CheR [Kofleriaceae bacterium]|nr:protein-glutamate O-methyltransferase CheR [Kofleriaceae bacterium]
MRAVVSSGDTERFRGLVRSWLGLEHDDTRLGNLAGVLQDRLRATGSPDLDAYARFAGSGDELRLLAERLTVGETFFFRNPDHFRALAEHVLPTSIRRNAANRRLRLLSLGCATGEEPHSIAILLREQFPELEHWEVELVGVDVNRASLARARAGRYGAWALRATPAEQLARWFTVEGRDHVLDARVRRMVTFVEHNLAAPAAAWWFGRWDVVMCRNVLMYFTPALAAELVARLRQSLWPDGYLFLGHAETVRDRAEGFRLCHTHDTFYYQATDAGGGAASWPPPLAPEPATAGGTGGMPSWFDEIERASRRIEALASDHRDRAQAPASVGAHAGPTAYARARALFEQERVDEALAALDGDPTLGDDRDALLLRAVLCTNRGRLVEAETACARLLARGVPEAGAHYLMALCRETAGDPAAAVEHDRAAIADDAGFAMAHLHLGRLRRRLDDVDGARASLRQALHLLEVDDVHRIALFGGGFRRDALVALCRRELAACGDLR